MSGKMFQKPELPENFASSEDEEVCAGHALGFPLRSELGFLPIENVTLDVFRCICEVYSTGYAQPWEFAMRTAESYLGSVEGPLLVARVTALLRALKCERNSGLCYLSVGCQHVSPDELTIAGILKSTRVKDEAAFERGIDLALAHSNAGARTRLAVRALAALQSHSLNHVSEADTGVTAAEYQSKQVAYLH
jgi:hypothetical protein